jgi:hypothetical protein
MASSGNGQDPTAVYQDMMGLQGLMDPNPYLEFTGQIPMAGYAGAPANASTGQPISSFQSILAGLNAQNPGTTLNSTGPGLSGAAGIPPMISSGGGQYTGGGQYAAGQMAGQNTPATMIPNPAYAAAQGQSAPTSSASSPSSSPNSANSRLAYLQALSNPGNPVTPGAQILPGTSMTGPVGSGQPSVLQSFLAAHPSGGKAIPGGYSNTSFFNTLNALQRPGATS